MTNKTAGQNFVQHTKKIRKQSVSVFLNLYSYGIDKSPIRGT